MVDVHPVLDRVNTSATFLHLFEVLKFGDRVVLFKEPLLKLVLSQESLRVVLLMIFFVALVSLRQVGDVPGLH